MIEELLESILRSVAHLFLILILCTGIAAPFFYEPYGLIFSLNVLVLVIALPNTKIGKIAGEWLEGKRNWINKK